MLKAIAIAKATKIVVRQIKKFDVNVSLDKATSKVVITVQRKKQLLGVATRPRSDTPENPTRPTQGPPDTPEM